MLIYYLIDLSFWRAGRPVLGRTMLGDRYSPQIPELTDWATSPRASSARWSVQSLNSRTNRLGHQSPSIKCPVVGAVPEFRTNRLGDQSPSIKCSVVSAVPEFPSWQTGRPVPEHTLLGGRCSPWTVDPLPIFVCLF